jgi:zinc protease
VDPGVRIGRLDNGLTYYVRENHKPEHRAELRVAVNAGSMLERDDQRGYAHFVEHMAFNGTEHFAANELISFLESIGTRFGPDLNAYTSFDETVYMLEVPTDREGLLDTGFLVLSDWAHAITFDPAEVVKERGVIIEEWRLGRGAQERIRQKQWPVLLAGSLYPERFPIGRPEVIESATADRVREFYRRWYRPDLMAVVAVGDFDAAAVEELIREHFGDIPRPADPADRATCDVPSHPGLRAAPALDPEQTVTQVSLVFAHPRLSQGTVGDYRRALVDILFSGMLNARFEEITQKPDAPFTFAGSGAGSFVRALDMFRVAAVVPDSGATRGLKAIVTETARVRAHGFTAGELERAKARFLASLERAYNERDKTESGAYVEEYTSNFLDGEPIPGIAVEFALAGEIMADITLDEVNAAVSRLVHRDNSVVLAAAPEKSGAALPDSSTLVAVTIEAEGTSPPAYEDVLGGTGLMAQLPEPGAVIARRAVPEMDLTILTLSNGVEVWLKPTDFKNDEILFSATASGGCSLADSSVYRSVSFADVYVQQAGFGGFTPVDLQKMLSGKIASAAPFIGDFQHGVQGKATPRDLETALQLTHLAFTAPDDRADAFEVLLGIMRTFLAGIKAAPEMRFADEVSIVNHRNHYMFRPLTVESLNTLDRDVAYQFYRKCFANAADFHFYFVGAFTVESIEPLLARYLGSLPSRPGPRSTYADPDVRFPDGMIVRTVNAGTEPKSMTQMSWPALTNLDEMEMFTLRRANNILETRLRELLREAMSGTYSVTVGLSDLTPYPGYAETSIGFGSAPETADTLAARIFEEIARFKRDGPTAEEVAKIQEIQIRELETSLKQNRYWLSSLSTVDLLGWDPRRILARRERIDGISARELQETFARYYPGDNHTVIRLMPEAPVEAAPR